MFCLTNIVDIFYFILRLFHVCHGFNSKANLVWIVETAHLKKIEFHFCGSPP